MTTTFQPAGYLIQKRPDEPPDGRPGTGFNYVMAGNGLFIQASSPLLEATIPIADVPVRGLAPLEPSLHLPHGQLPRHLLYHAITAMRRAAPNELFTAVTWTPTTGYDLQIPEQDAHRAHVSYQPIPNTVLEIHSHGTLRAFFSGQDNQDEQGFAVYGVVGRVTDRTELTFRVGIYGHFHPVPVSHIFSPETINS